VPAPGLLSMVYYVNDSDGDTFLFNEFQNSNKVTEVTLKQRVMPRKGRAVIFDSNRFHASSNPINNTSRFVINFTFKIHE
jgi:ectoine hydroxylase-related dioxygenase (phytanoyl-CoA dioxygenase family)